MGIASGVAAALARTATPGRRGRRRRARSRRRPPRSSPASRCRLARPPSGTSPSGTSTCSGCWSAPSASSSTSPACVRLRARGDRWPWYRTVLWVAGLLLLVLRHERRRQRLRAVPLLARTCSAHMVARPWRCPCCSCPARRSRSRCARSDKRTDGSRGGREWILLAVHSKFAAFIANPIVAGVLFAGVALGVLLHAAVPLVDARPRRPRVDDRALPDHRLPVRAVAHRHRPGAVPPAVPVPPACCCSARWRSTRSSASRS